MTPFPKQVPSEIKYYLNQWHNRAKGIETAGEKEFYAYNFIAREC
jgi:hypothetical protein